MISGLYRRILTRWMGFKIDVDQPIPPKFIIALAPHTSNWDFVIAILYRRAFGVKCQFMIKKAWFFWPLGYLMRAIGGIPVERGKRTNLIDQMVKVARESKTFGLTITPEGTRKPVRKWKQGFYQIGLKADLPILLFKLDYEKKLITCNKTIRPNGNVDEQMKEIKAYYKDCKGKHPENFLL